MTLKEWVGLEQLAREVCLRPQMARLLAKRYAAVPTRRPIPDSATGQRGIYWTREQVERIKRLRRDEGYEVP